MSFKGATRATKRDGKTPGKKPREFWSLVEKTDDCWLWRGSVNHVHGYGYYYHRGSHRAHRYAYIECVGPVPAGLVVCHKCDNKLCVRPDHLFAGSQADNIADKVAKGRQARGAAIGNAKLTSEDVAAIRSNHRKGKHKGEWTTAWIAAKYQIDKSNVRIIANRLRNWQHVL